jgi:hypothetical protein
MSDERNDKPSRERPERPDEQAEPLFPVGDHPIGDVVPIGDQDVEHPIGEPPPPGPIGEPEPPDRDDDDDRLSDAHDRQKHDRDDDDTGAA